MIVNVRLWSASTGLVWSCKRSFSRQVSSVDWHHIPNGTVIYSQSTDIFRNLSLEDWIYRNTDLRDKRVLLLWRNEPAVVIGRHQNPWLECHVSRCAALGASLARRNSGGGTVYHDLNNLNLSFLCDKKLYNRVNNLALIRDVLSDKFGIDSHINERQDLVLRETGHKISGTASKLGANKSYHHLTLLIDADLTRMRALIRKEPTSIQSKATESVRSKTANLSSVCVGIKLEQVVKEIGRAFGALHNVHSSHSLVEVEADDNTFNGIEEIEKNLRSWEWIYGKTPRFTISGQFSFNGNTFSTELTVFHGLIEKLVIEGTETDIGLKGTRFSEDYVSKVLSTLLSNDRDYEFNSALRNNIINCIRQSL